MKKHILKVLFIKMVDFFVNKQYLYELVHKTVELNNKVIERLKELSGIISISDASAVLYYKSLSEMAYIACVSYERLIEAHKRYIDLQNTPCIVVKAANKRALLNNIICNKYAFLSEEMALQVISFNFQDTRINNIYENIKIEACKDAISARKYASMSSKAAAHANILFLMHNSFDDITQFDDNNELNDENELLQHYETSPSDFYSELICFDDDTMSEEEDEEDEEIVEFFSSDNKENLKIIITNEIINQMKERVASPMA